MGVPVARDYDSKNVAGGICRCGSMARAGGFRLQGRDQYRDFLRDVILRPFLARIDDPDLKAQFLEELVEQAVTDPEFKLDYVRINLRGKKA